MAKTKDINMDTLLAYHNYLQGRIKDELNGLAIGPGRFYFFLSMFLYVFGVLCMVVGILVITLRHRHVYLVNLDYKFLGPAFIVMFILCLGIGTHLLVYAKELTNKYRRGLRFRPMGDYGVEVLHVSKIPKKERLRESLKSGHLQHVSSPAPRGMPRYGPGSMGDISRQSYNQSVKSERSRASSQERSRAPSQERSQERSRASSQDSIDKEGGRRSVRGRRDPNFKPRVRDADDSKSDSSRSRDPREGPREGRGRGGPRRPPPSNDMPPPPYPGGPHPRGPPVRGPPVRDPAQPGIDHGYQPRGRGGGPRPRGRGGRGGQQRPPGPRPGGDVHQPRRQRVEHDPRGRPPSPRQDSRPSSDDSMVVKPDNNTSSESEL